MTTSEKVAYLKGLVEGYGIAADAKEGKILSTVLDILEDLALDVEDMSANVAELEEGLDAVSDDLEDVEDLVYDDDEDDDEDEEDDDDDDEDEEDDEDPTFYEVECPSCGESITFDEGVLKNGGMECPNCGEHLEFDGEEDPETEEAPPEE